MPGEYPGNRSLESGQVRGLSMGKGGYRRSILFKGDEVGQMMKVVGEEELLWMITVYLKAELLDAVYLQQTP